MFTKATSVYFIVIHAIFFSVGLAQVEAQRRTWSAAYNCHYLVNPSQSPIIFRSGTFTFAPSQDDRSLYGSTGLGGSPITVSMEIQKARPLGPTQLFRLCRANFDINSADPYMGGQTGTGECSNGALYEFGQPIAWDSYSEVAVGGPRRWARCTVTITPN